MATSFQDAYGTPPIEQDRAGGAGAPRAEAPGPGFFESLRLGAERGGAQEDWGLNEANWEGRALHEIRGALRARGHDIPGMPDSLIPRDLLAEDYGNIAREEARNPSPWWLTAGYENRRRAAARALWDALAAERRRDPNFLSGYGDVHDYESLAAHAARRRTETVADVDARSRGGSVVGGFAGQIIHGLTDPLSYVPVGQAARGSTVARALLSTAVREAGANVAITAVTEPLVRTDAARLGTDRTAADFLLDLGASAATGAAIGGGFEGGRITIQSLTPLDWRVASAIRQAPIDPQQHGNLRLAQQFAAAVPPARRTPDEQAAVHVVTRDAEVRQASPFTGGPAGDDAHANLLDGAPHRAANGGRGGAVTAPRPAREQVKARIHRAETSPGDDYNEASGAAGPYQFLRSTWLSYYRRRYPSDRRPDAAIAGLRRDPAINDVLMNDMLADNAHALRRIGAPETAGNLYLLHAAGPGAGTAMLRADPEARAIDVYRRVDPRNADAAYRNNPWLRGSAGEAVAWAHRQMGGEAPTPIERAPDYAAAGDEDGTLRAELDAAEIERLTTERPTFDDRPVLRPELFDSSEQHARAQLAFELKQDAPEQVGDTRETMAPEAASGAPAGEAAARGSEGRAAETGAQRGAAAAAELAPVRATVKADAVNDFIIGSAMLPEDGAPGVSVYHFDDDSAATVVFRDEEGKAKGGLFVPLVDEALQNFGGVITYVDPAFRRQGVASALYDRARAEGLPIDRLSGEGDLTPSGAAFVNAQRARRAAREAEALTPAIADERFADPVGEGSRAQMESIEHDVRMLAEAEGAGGFRIDEEGGEKRLAEILEDLDEERAAIEEMRGCLAPAAAP